MSKLLWLALGFVAAGPLWVAATVWVTRRLWRGARRLSARTRGHEQLMELGHLAGGLAHEIKNPLSTINLNIKLLTEDLARSDDERHRRWLRRLQGVQAEADRLKDILNDFLKYAGKYEMNPELMDLRVVVGELADFFAPQAEAAKIVMRANLPDDPVKCCVDPRLLKQAMLNLMINGVQAMENGGELIVKLGAARGQGVIEVIDTGKGMSPEQAARVFQVYYSTKAGGSGLGLATTRRIIKASGGSIDVESEQGTGTRFVIRLPLGE